MKRYNGEWELPSAHSWIGHNGVAEVTADSFIQALSREMKNGEFIWKVFYCGCVNEAGDILHPSFSVLGLKGAPPFH